MQDQEISQDLDQIQNDILENITGDTASQTSVNSSNDDQTTTIINEFRAKYDDLQNKHLRLYADFENYKKEMITQRDQDTRRNKKQLILATILPLIENLKLAIDYAPTTEDPSVQKYLQTISHIFQKSISDIKNIGCQVIVPQKGDLFDEKTMEVIQVHEPMENVTAQTVVNVAGFGLKIDDLIIQPAKVTISG